MSTERDQGPAGVNLDEVTRLVEALERDLDKVREGSSDVATLRSEVDQLRSALQSSEPAERDVHSGLENVRDLLHRAGDELLDDAVKVGEYVTRIGRMLGL
jgi:phage gp16-like protein